MVMKIAKSEKSLCTCCMEEHEVKTVLVKEAATFYNVKVSYEASYFCCDRAEELHMNKQQMQGNDAYLKAAYYAC